MCQTLSIRPLFLLICIWHEGLTCLDQINIFPIYINFVRSKGSLFLLVMTLVWNIYDYEQRSLVLEATSTCPLSIILTSIYGIRMEREFVVNSLFFVELENISVYQSVLITCSYPLERNLLKVASSIKYYYESSCFVELYMSSLNFCGHALRNNYCRSLLLITCYFYFISI